MNAGYTPSQMMSAFKEQAQSQGTTTDFTLSEINSIQNYISESEKQAEPQAFTKDKLSRLILNDIATTGGRNVSNYQKLFSMIGTEEEEKPLTEKEMERQNVNSQLEEAYNQLVSNPELRTGMVGGPLEGIKAKFGAGDPATIEFNTRISGLMATIAKARAGTSFTPNEQKLLERYAPKVGDSRQELETKLRVLMSISSGGTQDKWMMGR